MKFVEACPIQEVYRGDPEEKKSHMNVPPWLGSAGTAAGHIIFLEQSLHPYWVRPAREGEAKQEMIERWRLWKKSTIFVGSEIM